MNKDMKLRSRLHDTCLALHVSTMVNLDCMALETDLITKT